MYDFSEEVFDNIVIKEERGLVEIQTNANSKESALRWKNIYCEKFNFFFFFLMFGGRILFKNANFIQVTFGSLEINVTKD